MNNLQELKTQDIDYRISSDEDLKRLTLILRRIDETIKNIEDKLRPEIANAYLTHKGLMTLLKDTKKPFDDCKEKINQSIKGWYYEKDQEAKALQAKINEQLAKSAEEEKQRLLKEAEGSDEWNKEIKTEQAQAIVPVTVGLKDCKESVQPKTEGQYKRSNYKARVIDPVLVPERFWLINFEMLDKEAKRVKGTSHIPGVEFYDDFTIVTKQ